MSETQKHAWSRFSMRSMLILVSLTCGLLAFGKWAFGPEVDQIPFDSALWKLATPIERRRTVRSQMIESLLQRYDFQGWTEQEVVQLLGEPDAWTGFSQWDIVYVLGMERAGSFSLDDEALGFKLDKRDRVVVFGLSVN